MSRYQVMLTSDLEESYQMIAKELKMSMEQILSAAVQIYAERLTLTPFESAGDVERMRDYETLYREGSAR